MGIKLKNKMRSLLSLLLLGLALTFIAGEVIKFGQSPSKLLSADISPPLLAQSNDRLLTRSEANDLPVFNRYLGTPGCYIACYSDDPGEYKVEDKWIHGLIRVPGRYSNTSCNPEGRNVQEFQRLCNQNLESCQDCWAGEDTGRFF